MRSKLPNAVVDTMRTASYDDWLRRMKAELSRKVPARGCTARSVRLYGLVLLAVGKWPERAGIDRSLMDLAIDRVMRDLGIRPSGPPPKPEPVPWFARTSD
jgi:hypothetical protein